MADSAPRRAARIVLHIGAEKTGTTTIQAFCALNRQALRNRGVFYPDEFGPNNHLALAAAFGDLAWLQHVGPTESWRGEQDQRRYRADVMRRLAALSREAAGKTLLLSSEHLSSRLHGPPVAALREALAPLADRIDVVIFLRRQDELLLSLYSTYIKSGGTLERDWLGNVSWFDFDECLSRWEVPFGLEHVTVRRYQPPGGSLVTDFFVAAGLPIIKDGIMPPALNRSLDARNLMLLKAINARVASWGKDGYLPQRIELVRLLEQRSTGAPSTMSLAERQAFLARFANCNERVRLRHFPEDSRLFDPPVASTCDGEAVGFDDAIDLIAELLLERPLRAQSRTDRLVRAGARRWRALRRRALGLRLR